MSIYDKASLVLIPSGTKTSKVYSQVPVSGDGDFTFSRSTAATRVNADGIIEKETQNLLLHSNTFSNAVWVNNAGSCTRTSGQSGYDGSNDAWLLTQDSAGYDNIVQSVSSSGVNTYSIYVKGTSTAFTLRITNTGDRVLFNLSTGSVASTFGSNLIDYGMTDVGGGWYRCYLTANATITDLNIYPYFNSTTATSVTIQDAQLEQGLVARDYIETTTTAVEGGITDNVPRLDYTDSSCPALLLEPQRTNSMPQSEYFGDWSNVFGGTGSAAVLTANDAISPEGVQNAYKIVFDAGSGTTSGDSCQLSKSVTFPNNTDGTSSIYLKGENGGEQIVFRGVADGTYTLLTLTTEWQRFDTTENSGTTSDGITFGIRQNVSGLGVINSSATIYAYGAQVEAGSYATSYIPTYGSAVTRNKDEFSIANQPQLFGDSEGTLFIDRSALGLYDDYSNISLNSGNFTNSLGIRYNPNANTMLAQCRVNNANEAFLNHSVTDITDRSKAAFGYKTNDFVFYVDGSSVGTETSGNTFPDGTITHMKSSRGDADDFFYGRIYQILVFTTRLTNAELADLTTL